MTQVQSQVDFLILTASYQRGEQLLQIVEKLKTDAEEHGFSCKHVIVDDCSESDAAYEQISAMSKQKGAYQVIYHRNPTNNGRAAFWQTINTLWGYAKKFTGTYKYAIQLADDLMPCDDFLGRTSRLFDELRERDASICVMNTQNPLLRNWETPRYIDGAYIADEIFFQALDYAMESTDITIWRDNPQRGSGTGFQMTQRMAAHELKIAPCQDIAFCKPMDCPSVMFPSDIRPSVWWRDNYIDKGTEKPMELDTDDWGAGNNDGTN